MGPPRIVAQNGIQIGFGAKGTITGNAVSEVIYAPCVSTSSCGASSTGILVHQASSPTNVSSNTVTTTQTGIYLDVNSSTASSNLIINTEGVRRHLCAVRRGPQHHHRQHHHQQRRVGHLGGWRPQLGDEEQDQRNAHRHSFRDREHRSSAGSGKSTFYNVPLTLDEDASICAALAAPTAGAAPAPVSSPAPVVEADANPQNAAALVPAASFFFDILTIRHSFPR